MKISFKKYMRKGNLVCIPREYILYEKEKRPDQSDQGEFSCGGNGWVGPLPATNWFDISQER
jgi:hypothetical protein